jgi:hypothetical protein
VYYGSRENLRVEDRWQYQHGDETLMAQRLLEAADAVDYETEERSIGIIDRLCIYGDRAAIPSSIPLTPAGGGIKRRNPVPNALDTLIADATKDPVRAMFLTVGGTWDQRRTAEKLTAACGWVFDRQKVLPKMRRAALDALVTGCGWLRPVEGIDGSITIERIYPGDVLVDDRACVDELPREMFLRRWVDRGMLWELYPDARQMIEEAGNASDRYAWALNNPHSPTADVIELIEAWHLPSYQPFIRDGQEHVAGDGHWALAIRTGGESRGGILDHAPYDRPTFPVVGLRALPPSRGYWGLPLIDRPAASGLDLNKLYQRIAEMLHRIAVSRVYVDEDSGVRGADLKNTIGAVIRYRGRPPVFDTPVAASPELYQHSERLEANVFKDTGISEMSATSVKPAGLLSGRAIRVARETQTLRHVCFADEIAAAYCLLAMRWAEAEAQASEDDPQRRTPYEVDGCQDEIDWRKASRDLDSMVTTPRPTSGLATTPAARAEDLENVTAGILSPLDALRLSRDPDFESIREERLASENRLRQLLGRMLDGGTYEAPDPEMDLARGVELALAKIHAAAVQGCPASRIDMVRRWRTDAMEKLKQATAPPPGAVPPMPGPEAGVMPEPAPGPEMMPPGAAPGMM